jgi:hypothetical protein
MRTMPRLAHGLLTLVALLGLLVPTSGWALALQESEMPAGATAAMGAMMVVMLIFAAAIYVYIALCLQTIAKKTNTENAWMAWIPIVNVILMLNIAKKPLWWIILMLIPLVNIVIAIIVWMAIAEARGKPSWWGILLIVPVVGIIVPGYLAFSD